MTGLLFGAFGISTFCFVILITYIVNPNNEKATLIVIELTILLRLKMDIRLIIIFLMMLLKMQRKLLIMLVLSQEFVVQ